MLRKRLPKGFRRGHDDSLACPHREVTCCPECAGSNPEIIEVFGRHYWISDEKEHAETLAMLREGSRS